jgi:hypothetical protein
VRRMQKSLDQMNVRLHRAVSDVNGVTGMAILRAIVNGERPPWSHAGQAAYARMEKGLWLRPCSFADYRTGPESHSLFNPVSPEARLICDFSSIFAQPSYTAMR